MSRAIRPIVVLLLGACASIGVHRQSRETWLEASNRSILTTRDVSEVTFNMLRRRGLHEGYKSDPVAALTALQEEMRKTRERALAVAIAELGYLQARRWTNVERRALATTIRYSYAYLFDPELQPEPEEFDAQFRWACDLYATALADLLRVSKREDRERPRRTVEWYGGSSELRVGRNELAWGLDQYDELHVAYDYVVEGLPRPDTRRGFGVPCILRRGWSRQAAQRGVADVRYRFLPPDLAFSATVVARYPDGTSVLHDEQPPLSVEVLDPTRTVAVDIEGERVPLEIDYTTPVATVLSGRSQNIGISALLRGDEYEKKGGLYMFQPYEEGRIVILFIHGLASDPLTWLPLYADLMADETIRTRCQFLFWFYPTGQPIFQSARQLRAALRETYELVDADESDPANDHVLVCGHSMGGILTRSLVVDTGTKLWDVVFDKPPGEFDLPAEELRSIEEALIFEPLPFIRRVIFYATPHRGSPVAQEGIVDWATGRLALPKRTLGSEAAIRRVARPEFRRVGRITGIQSLRQDNPVLVAHADLPISPRVTYHSIIGDREGDGRTDGTDGLVPYESSHVPGAASEIVLKSGHSVQQTPRAAQETRRIVLEHIAAYDAARGR